MTPQQIRGRGCSELWPPAACSLSLSLSFLLSLSLSFLHSLKILSFWDRKSVIGLKNHLQQHYQRAHTIKTLIQHWGINILVRPRRVLSVLCACVCVCVSSCMSILSCPGVLSGSRAAWSREITLGIMGAAGWGWGGGEDDSQLLERCQTTAEKSITFPHSRPNICLGWPQQTPPPPRCSVHAEPRRWFNGCSVGGERCRCRGNCGDRCEDFTDNNL